MLIQNDKVVTMHYHLTDPDGQVLDSSRGSDPLTYLHGAGHLIRGLEQALTGLDVGATKTVEVAPADAYGEHDADGMQTVPRQELAGIENLQVGMQLQARRPNGESVTFFVAEIREHEVLLNPNHPLAGVALTFDVEILDIRDATAEELSHGHVHGAGGHHH
jgi:FKBP-type peptidyl-prolyl cis-trans isomerase SlyD